MDDYISRQAAIDAVHVNYDKFLDFKSTGRTVADSIEDIINALPSAEPERKEGCWMTQVYEYGDGVEVEDRWVEQEAQRGDYAYCSECKGVAGLDGSEEYTLTQFCPHCGAKMKNAEKKI